MPFKYCVFKMSVTRYTYKPNRFNSIERGILIMNLILHYNVILKHIYRFLLHLKFLIAHFKVFGYLLILISAYLWMFFVSINIIVADIYLYVF